MPPMITERDYTTQLPSELSDTDLEDEEHRMQWEATPATSARASFQRLLAQSITLRIETARVINSLQEEPSYDEVLSLGNKLTEAFCRAAKLIDHATSEGSSNSISQFACCFCRHLLHRFLLCLHVPYAVKAKQMPKYAHSQKVSLEVAQEIVSLLDNDLYGRGTDQRGRNVSGYHHPWGFGHLLGVELGARAWLRVCQTKKPGPSGVIAARTSSNFANIPTIDCTTATEVSRHSSFSA